MCLEKILNLFKKTTPPVPILDTDRISREDFIKELLRYGVVPMAPDIPLDPFLVLESKGELDRIAPSLTYPGSWYEDNIWDCENYGMQAANDAGRLFHCSVLLCLGYMEQGYHGFALAMDKDKNVWLLEPNQGFTWSGRWFAPTLDLSKPLTGEMYVPIKVLV